MWKRWGLVLGVSFFICVLFIAYCGAEKIYCKDGRVVTADILYRSKGSVWVKASSGAIGIGTQDIDKIEDNSGSISKYDYKSLLRSVRELITQKKYDEAVGLCGILLKSFPDDTQIHYLRGLLNQKIGNFKEAAEDYHFLIDHGIADVQIFNNLGVICAKRKEPKEAQGFFLKAIENNPDIIEVHNNLADLSLETKDYSRAIDEYNRVIDKDPNNAKALYGLGIAYMNTENYSKAKEQWEKVLVIRPEDNDAKNALEYLRVKND